MKKMIFSAVALVAFSISGMANEIEEKKVVNEEKVENNIKTDIVVLEEEIIVPPASECAQYARSVILKAAATYKIDISRESSYFGLMMEFYHEIFNDCYYNN
jgi:hypothetical protein